MSADWHLAQINIGRLVAPRGDPRVEPFFAALDRINALAEAAPGFVWRLQDESGNATGIRFTPDPLMALNMSVWRDAQSLFDFVYRSAHTPVMARRREYFARFNSVYQALWWIEAGTIPTINDGLAKLWLLEQNGPNLQAFTFKTQFPAPDGAGSPIDHRPDPWCVGTA
ncbi:MAG: DUF3291 domain-containing protein [Novosphingobium sp.]|nr:DUF3291 domain-containing protein [Novosphingobium sp.]